MGLHSPPPSSFISCNKRVYWVGGGCFLYLAETLTPSSHPPQGPLTSPCVGSLMGLTQGGPGLRFRREVAPRHDLSVTAKSPAGGCACAGTCPEGAGWRGPHTSAAEKDLREGW